MNRIASVVRSKPLASAALLLVVVKAMQFAIDRTPLFYSDSGAFIINATRAGIITFRSYVYGWFIRFLVVPTASLTTLVALQMLMGAAIAWMLALVLVRYFSVRGWIAVAMALLFAFDPVQVVHEHLVMTETSALFALVLLLLASLEYLRRPRLYWMVAIPVLGIGLVSLRTVYVPLSFALAIALPFAAHVRWSGSRWRVQSITALLLGLILGGTVTLLCHAQYRQYTGNKVGREPIYHDWEGVFQLAVVVPLLQPQDTEFPAVAALMERQRAGEWPLEREDLRAAQLWTEAGLVTRLRTVFDGDFIASDREAANMARRAIRRNPVGFLGLAGRTYLRYWTALWDLKRILPVEHGERDPTPVMPLDAELVEATFGFDPSTQNHLHTPSRRYHLWARWWCLFLMSAPLLGWVAVWWAPAEHRVAAGLLAVASGITMAVLCLGGMEPVYRYLHPFSFTGLAAVGVLGEAFLNRRSGPRERRPDSQAAIS